MYCAQDVVTCQSRSPTSGQLDPSSGHHFDYFHHLNLMYQNIYTIIKHCMILNLLQITDKKPSVRVVLTAVGLVRDYLVKGISFPKTFD